jgi:hypothetical protein
MKKYNEEMGNILIWYLIKFTDSLSLIGIILSGDTSNDRMSTSKIVAASGKVLIQGGESDGLSPSSDSTSNAEIQTENSQVHISNFTS